MTPQISKINVRSDGMTLDIIFASPVDITQPAGYSSGFSSGYINGSSAAYDLNPTITATGGMLSASYLSGAGGLTLTYNLSRTVYSKDVLGITFENSAINEDGERLTDQSFLIVNNFSEQLRTRQGGQCELKADTNHKHFNRLDPFRRSHHIRRAG